MARRILAAFVPLVDCAPLVVAAEKGFARGVGMELQLVREPSWSSLRDHLVLGHVDCAHALAPLPIASSLGVGHVEADLVVPLVLSRGGNAITLAASLADDIRLRASDAMPTSAAAWARALAQVVAARSKPLTLAMVHPFSGHNFELRYWLAEAGIHPDNDVRIVAIPPPLMVESLAAGHVDGFCVGEPWNSLAVERGIGRIVATKMDIFPGGVEKVLAVGAGFAADRGALAALVTALSAAAQWADDPANRAETAALLAASSYVAVRQDIIARALAGRLLLGSDATLDMPDFLYFHRHGAGRASAAEALWIYAQMLRWGQLAPGTARSERAARVFRPELAEHVNGPELSAGLSEDVLAAARNVDAYVSRCAVRTPFIAPVATP